MQRQPRTPEEANAELQRAYEDRVNATLLEHAGETMANATNMAIGAALTTVIMAMPVDQRGRVWGLLTAHTAAVMEEDSFSNIPAADKLFRDTFRDTVDTFLEAASDKE